METKTQKPKRFICKQVNRASGTLKEHIVLLDAEDAYHLRSNYWTVVDNHNGGIYLVKNRPSAAPEYLHVLVAGGQRGELVQHINGNTLDNRKVNLLRASNRIEELDD